MNEKAQGPAKDACRLANQKYPCKDCHSCQFCSESRCALCRKGAAREKMTREEQILLYNTRNRGLFGIPPGKDPS
jgi:hypothetical protein